MTYLLAAAALLLAALALWVVWIFAVLWYYRLEQQRPQLLRARCEDGWEIAVHFRPAVKKRFEEPVLLCHGFAANRYTFDFDPPWSVAHFLSAAGFDCYTVEWRGTGASRRPPHWRRWSDYSVDDHIRLDAPALVDLALEHSGAARAFWLGHSLGALIGYAYAQGPGGGKLAGLLALGAPVFFKYDPLMKGAAKLGALIAWPFGLRQRLMSISVAPLMGRVVLPVSDIVINPQAIPPHLQRKVYTHLVTSVSHKVMRQFDDWIAHDAFRSLDGAVDYRAGLSKLSFPILVMGGSVDRLAPPTCVQAQYERLTTPDKTLMIFGPENGDTLGYGHGDLLYGANAPTEVYPPILRWLEARATPAKAGGALPE